MTKRVVGVKKSKFNDSGTTQISDSATFDFVENGQNIKKTFKNLLPQLGTTGLLVQEGDPLAVPILDDQGVIKGIRNLASGFGIDISVDSNNSAEISTNFTFDETGVALVDDPLSSSPTFRSLVAGSGIAIGGSAGQIQISATGTPISTKTIIISVFGDLPTPVLNVITLADDTEYFHLNDVDYLTNRVVLGNNTIITGSDSLLIDLNYTGTDDFITAVDTTNLISFVQITCPNARVFNQSKVSGVSRLLLNQVRISSCDKLGIATNVDVLVFISLAVPNITTDGVEFVGNIGVLKSVLTVSTLNAGAFYNLGTAVFGLFSTSDSIYTLPNAGTFVIDGLTDSGNISGFGTAFAITVVGSGSALNGVSENDARWQFLLNSGIADTRTDGLLSLQGNATNTVITTIGVPVKVAGTWVVEVASQMTGDTTGRLTYDGVKNANLPITASVTVEPVSGGSQNISAYIAIDGVFIANSKRTLRTSSGTPLSISVPWQITAPPATFIEVFVSNDSTTTDILISSGILRAN